MNGICGIFNLDNRDVDPSLLQRMLDTLDFTRAGEIAIWSEGPAALGNCGLNGNPGYSEEHQLVKDPAGEIVITSDARIDNRSELITELKLFISSKDELTDTKYYFTHIKNGVINAQKN